MALMKCRECGKQISTKAISCPSCGARKAKATSFATWLAAIFVGLPVLAAVFLGASRPPSDTGTLQHKTPSAEDLQVNRAAIGARLLKKSMRDPDSFKLEAAIVTDKTGAVCYEYRARNGFGGVNIGHAVLSSDAKRFLNQDDKGFASLWGTQCQNKVGRDVSTSINWFAL